jgi:hypothetical protein
MTDPKILALADETVIDLFRYACEQHDEAAADVLEAEICRRGIYGRPRQPEPEAGL